jgi:hypothetical protein
MYISARGVLILEPSSAVIPVPPRLSFSRPTRCGHHSPGCCHSRAPVSLLCRGLLVVRACVGVRSLLLSSFCLAQAVD